MADDKKEKKKKKKESGTDAPSTTPAGSKSSSKKAKRGGSNVFDQFSQKQVAEFKEGFQFMDHDKDGILSKEDLRATCDEVGKLTNDSELEEMVTDAPGPINFTMLINMFGQRESGGQSDEDEVVIKAFKAFEEAGGVMDSETIRNALMTWGEKYSAQEVDDFFDQVNIDDGGKINIKEVIEMVTGKADADADAAAAAADAALAAEAVEA